MTIPFFRSSELIERHIDPHKINNFLNLVLETNKHINIVSRETSHDDLISLSADCLIPLELGIELAGPFFDIGPGGGFPSVILMLANPELSGTLIERTRKKAEFLGRCADEFGLDAEVIPRDFSEAVSDLPERHYSFGVMKYVRLDRKILNGASKILRSGGKFIYYSRFDKKKLPLPKGLMSKSCQYFLDDSSIVRTLTVFSFGSR